MRPVPYLLSFALLLAACTPAIHVSPFGDDAADGGRRNPVLTLSEAVGRAGDNCTIVLHEGEYFLEEAVRISGIRKLTIRPACGDKILLRGDKDLVFSALDKNELAGIVPEKARARIVKADLAAAGISDFGNAAGRDNRFDLYWNGISEKPARWPDHGYTRAGKVLGADKPEPDCCMEGIFRYEDERIDRWADEKGGALHGFFCYAWKDDHHPMVALDPSTRTMEVDGSGNDYGFRDGFKFYGEHILCELDCPGEYYVDRDKGVLYWFPETSYEAGNDQVSFSCTAGGYLLDIRDCPRVRLKGIRMCGGRDSGIRIHNCPGARIMDCRLTLFGKDGIHLEHSDGARVQGCSLHGLGETGFFLENGDRKTLSPAGIRLTRNTVSDFSRFTLTYKPAFHVLGCGYRLDRNEAFFSPSSALRVEGNEILLDRNHFHDLVTVSDDQGALDIFGDYHFRGIEIRNNLWEDITGNPESEYGAAAVRLDDMICGVKVLDNRFVNCGAKKFGAIQINGGKDNVIEGNRFIRCATGVSFTPWSKERWEKVKATGWRVKRDADTVGTLTPLYLEKYPSLRADPVSDVSRNFIRRNVFEDCGRLFCRENGRNVIEGNEICTP